MSSIKIINFTANYLIKPVAYHVPSDMILHTDFHLSLSLYVFYHRIAVLDQDLLRNFCGNEKA